MSERPQTTELSLDLARQNPERFRDLTIGHMTARSTYGLQVMNVVMRAGQLDPRKIEIDPDSWVSFNLGEGGVRLGAAPMGARQKEDIFFHGERLSYPDEVAYRMLHEFMHSFLLETQHNPATRTLRQLTQSVREQNGGESGLTALGSLGLYRSRGPDIQAKEDATELLTMFAWQPDYAEEFTRFLADPRMSSVRQEVGLRELHPEAAQDLYALIATSVEEGLPATP